MKKKQVVDTPYKNSWADEESKRIKSGIHPLAPKLMWVKIK